VKASGGVPVNRSSGRGFLLAGQPGEVAGVVGAVGHDPHRGHGGRAGRLGQRAGEPAVTQRQADLRDLADRGQLAGPQQRHGRHRHAAGSQHAEPARHQPRVVRAAEQHPVAGHDAQVLGQHPGDLAGHPQEVAVAPALVRRQQARPVGPVRRDRRVEQLGRAVQPGGIPQRGQREAQLRPVAGRGQVVTAERVGVGGRR